MYSSFVRVIVMDLVFRVEDNQGDGAYAGRTTPGVYDLGTGVHDEESHRPGKMDLGYFPLDRFKFGFSSMHQLFHWFDKIPEYLHKYREFETSSNGFCVSVLEVPFLAVEDEQVVYLESNVLGKRRLSLSEMHEFCKRYEWLTLARGKDSGKYMLPTSNSDQYKDVIGLTEAVIC